MALDAELAELVVASLFIGAIGLYRQDKMFAALNNANEQLVTLSTTDGPTGLLNRRALIAESEKLFALMRRSGQPLAVFMIDLDYFKNFNDSYGHQAGDRAIRCQADIRNSIFKRETDIIGRYGGEEFMVVAAGSNVSEFERNAAEILAQWQSMAVRNEGSLNGKFLSCSIGICYDETADFDSIENMIQPADQTLFCAKDRGRGMFSVA